MKQKVKECNHTTLWELKTFINNGYVNHVIQRRTEK